MENKKGQVLFFSTQDYTEKYLSTKKAAKHCSTALSKFLFKFI